MADVELSSAYISVIAKMPGVTKSVNAALGNVDVGAAGKRIGQKVSDAVGKNLKDQVAKKFAEATAAALEKQSTATKKLEDAQFGLRKAYAQNATAQAKVTASEATLEALRKSGTATTDKLQTAEANLERAQAALTGTGRGVASAQNAVTAAKRTATDASKAYTDALAAEKSKSAQALEWMPLASARVEELAGKWRTAGSQISGVGDTFTTSITKPAITASGVLATLVGALGFKRLVGIDTARGQFQGLGLDVEAVMRQVDAGVTNTSLSMAQGASLAVGILATGNVPLTGLEAQIKRVANVSAAYGVDAEHAAYLLNNVLVKNKVTWGDLSQMQQNQIPIVTQLAGYYGVAGDAIMDMAQNGEISVADLNAALDQNAGAAAEAYASTWKGVTANILANLGRIGAKFLEPSFVVMKEQAAEFLAFLKTDEFSVFATDIGAKIGELVTRGVEGIKTFVNWWANLSEEQKKLIGVAAGVVVALGPVLRIVGGLVTGVGTLISTARFGIAVWTGWKAAVGGAALASDMLTAKTKAQTVAMHLGAAAQKSAALAGRGLSAALSLIAKNPIITAITLIVAGLVWFFTQTEVGKKIWAEFTRFLGEAWVNISAFFTAAYENVIRPVLEGIGTVAKWIFENVLQPAFTFAKVGFEMFVNGIKAFWEGFLKPVFDGIAAVAQWVFNFILLPIFKVVQLAFAVLAGIFVGIWEYILKPVFDAIGAIFKWLWETIIRVVIEAIKIQIRAWAAVFTWLWNVILKPTFTLIGQIFTWIWENIIRPIVDSIKLQIQAWAIVLNWLWINVVQPVFAKIGEIFNWIWVNVIRPVVDSIKAKFDMLGQVFRWLYENVVKPVWDKISSTIKNVWENGIKPVIDTLAKVIESDPKKAFEMARDAVGVAWKGIQDLAKKPVKFVVETVIGGMIDAVNGFLPDGMKLKKPTLPKGFAGGGVLPGYMSARRDDVLMPMRSGEGVLVPEVVRGLGPNFVHSLNAVGNTGGVSAVRSTFGALGAGLASGGLVTPLPKGSYSVSQPYHGGHNGIDLAAAAGTKVYAAADGVVGLASSVNMGGNEVYIQHTNGLGTRYSHLSRFATSAGNSVKQGNVIGYVGSTGMSTGPHLHYMVHRPGLGGGNYANHVNPAPYLGLYGADLGEAGGAGGAAGILGGLVDMAAAKIKEAFPGGGIWIDIAAGLAKNAAESMAKAFDPFGAADGHTQPALYDDGGWLKPGMNLVQNKSGRPEPVLTAAQWDALVAGGGRGDVYVQNPFTGDYLLAVVDERADRAVDRGLEDELAMSRRGAYS